MTVTGGLPLCAISSSRSNRPESVADVALRSNRISPRR
jgi:hypothetical protein